MKQSQNRKKVAYHLCFLWYIWKSERSFFPSNLLSACADKWMIHSSRTRDIWRKIILRIGTAKTQKSCLRTSPFSCFVSSFLKITALWKILIWALRLYLQNLTQNKTSPIKRLEKGNYLKRLSPKLTVSPTKNGRVDG